MAVFNPSDVWTQPYKGPVFVMGPDSLEFDGEFDNLDWVKLGSPYSARMVEIASALKEKCEAADVPLIFKASYHKSNRTGQGTYTGPTGSMAREKSLAVLGLIGRELQLPVHTDYHYPGDAAEVSRAVDMLQVPADQAKIEMLLEEGLKATNGKNSQPHEQKPLFVKLPPQFKDSDIVAYAKKFLFMHKKIYGEDAAPPQIAFCYRGSYKNQQVIFEPDMVIKGLEEVRQMGIKVAMDVSHPIERGKEDDASSSHIKGNMRRAAHYHPDFIFCEAKLPGWQMKCDNDRMLVVDEGTADLLRDVSATCRDIPANSPQSFASAIALRKSRPRVSILVGSETPYEMIHSLKNYNAASASTAVLVSHVQQLESEGYDVVLADVRDFFRNGRIDQAKFDAVLKPGPDSVAIFDVNKIAESCKLFKAFMHAGGIGIVNCPNPHFQYHPDAGIQDDQKYMLRTAHMVLTNNSMTTRLVDAFRDGHRKTGATFIEDDAVASAERTSLPSRLNQNVKEYELISHGYARSLEGSLEHVRDLQAYCALNSAISVNWSFFTNPLKDTERGVHGGDIFTALNAFQTGLPNLKVSVHRWDRETFDRHCEQVKMRTWKDPDFQGLIVNGTPRPTDLTMSTGAHKVHVSTSTGLPTIGLNPHRTMAYDVAQAEITAGVPSLQNIVTLFRQESLINTGNYQQQVRYGSTRTGGSKLSSAVSGIILA